MQAPDEGMYEEATKRNLTVFALTNGTTQDTEARKQCYKHYSLASPALRRNRRA